MGLIDMTGSKDDRLVPHFVEIRPFGRERNGFRAEARQLFCGLDNRRGSGCLHGRYAAEQRIPFHQQTAVGQALCETAVEFAP